MQSRASDTINLPRPPDSGQHHLPWVNTIWTRLMMPGRQGCLRQGEGSTCPGHGFPGRPQADECPLTGPSTVRSVTVSTACWWAHSRTDQSMVCPADHNVDIDNGDVGAN